MKLTQILVTTALLGGMGAGLYYRQDIRKVFSPPEVAQAKDNSADLHAIVQQVYQQTKPQTPEQFVDKARELKEGAVLFAYSHSSEILAGKYDAQLEALTQKAGKFFGNLEQEGRERMHTLYGSLGDKMNEKLLKLRREMCRGELRNMSKDIEQVLEKYQK